jgi:hypothetical protein
VLQGWDIVTDVERRVVTVNTSGKMRSLGGINDSREVARSNPQWVILDMDRSEGAWITSRSAESS